MESLKNKALERIRAIGNGSFRAEAHKFTRLTPALSVSGKPKTRTSIHERNASIVSRVWSFCTTLRDDGVSYGDYLEQLTYLIFLKMADEYSRPPYSRKIGIPENLGWASLKVVRGAALEVHYVTVLRELGSKPGLLGQIFNKAQNKDLEQAAQFRAAHQEPVEEHRPGWPVSVRWSTPYKNTTNISTKRKPGIAGRAF